MGCGSARAMRVLCARPGVAGGRTSDEESVGEEVDSGQPGQQVPTSQDDAPLLAPSGCSKAFAPPFTRPADPNTRPQQHAQPAMDTSGRAFPTGQLGINSRVLRCAPSAVPMVLLCSSWPCAAWLLRKVAGRT